MRGIAFALVALSFAATTPAAAQCFGPECDPRSNAPGFQSQRPDFHPSQPGGQPSFRQAPFEQGQSFGPPGFDRGQQFQPGPGAQPPYQQPAYRAQPRPPAGYSNVPPGMPPGMSPGMAPRMPPGMAPGMPPGVALRGQNYLPHHPYGRPGVRTPDMRTRVTKTSKPPRAAVRQHYPAPQGRTVGSAPRPAGSGQITISMAEYRDLQNQARELQRILSGRTGAPSRSSPFPDARPLPVGNPPGQ